MLENGRIISIIEKEKKLRRIVVAAPIKIGDTRYYMGVMLNRDTSNQRLYLHDVTISEEASDLWGEHLSTTGPAMRHKNLFLTSILGNIDVVNYKKEMNQKYIDAVNTGDMETAQQIVDQAAILSGAAVMPSGKVKRYYHGTRNDFTAFDIRKAKKGNHGYGFYLTMVKSFASEYGEPKGVFLMTERIAGHDDHEITSKQIDRVMKQYGIEADAITGRSKSMQAWIDERSDATILQNLQDAIVRKTMVNPEQMLKFFQKVFSYDGLRVARETVLWDNRLVKSADPVTYDDAGNVIPLFERFDTQDGDIRYSREMDTVAALEAQNRILRQQKEHWKRQARSTQGHRKADAMEVRRLCREIVSEYSSTTRATEIAEGMQWLADQWADPKADAGYGAMADYAVELARQIVAGSEVDLNADMAEIRQELTGYLRSTPIHITESIKAGIPDFADFKKRNRTLRFREDGSGTAVDAMWLELQDMFGTGMFPESIMNPEDQVRYIAETLEDMREVLVNPYGVEMELAVQQLANDLLWRTSQLSPEKPTRVDAAVERATREMQTLLEEGRERERRRISQAQDTQQRQRIRKVGEQFRRMVERPGRADSQHAPAGLAKAAMEICEILNDSELRRMDRWERALERRADALGSRAAGLGDFAPAVMYQEFDAIENSQRRQTEVILFSK